MSPAAVSIRVPEHDLEEIDRRAKARGLSRTAFMLEVALADELATTSDEARFERLEDRLDLVEARLFT